MKRKTALQILTCLIGYPLLRAQEKLPSSTGNSGTTGDRLDMSNTWLRPTVLTISMDAVKHIELRNGSETRIVTMAEIWEALDTPQPAIPKATPGIIGK